MFCTDREASFFCSFFDEVGLFLDEERYTRRRFFFNLCPIIFKNVQLRVRNSKSSMGDSLSDDEAENEREEVNTDLVVGYESEKIEVSYNKRDLLLYALGIGCRNKAEEIFYTFEEHDSFQAFPTFPVVLPFKGTETDVVPFPSPTLMSFPPGLPIINPALILHAEEAIEIFQDLDIDGGHFTKMNKIIG